jgi:hypothetical protein
MLVKIERSVFFPFVRTVAFVGALVLLIAICVGLFFLVTFNGIKPEQVKISFSELQALIDGGNAEEDAGTWLQNNPWTLKNIEKVYDDLRKYNDEISLHEFSQYIYQQFGTDPGRGVNNFLENLSRILSEAEKKDPENVTEYIDAYVGLYNQKTSKSSPLESLGLGSKFDQAVSQLIQYLNGFVTSAIKGAIFFTILFLFVIFTIMVALLLLLSIERNTRRPS